MAKSADATDLSIEHQWSDLLANVVKLGERLTDQADANAEPSPVTGRCRD